MTRMYALPMLCLALCCALTTSASAGQPTDGLTGKEIVKRTLKDQLNAFSSGQAIVTMQSKAADGTIPPESRILIRADEKNGLARTRIQFQAPSDKKGIEVLMLAQNSGPGLLYLYLKGYKKAKQISGGGKNGAFPGTDFTYADLENRDVNDSTYVRHADEVFGKRDCYRVDATPKKGSTTPYSKVAMWIDKKAMLPLKTEFFDGSGKLARVLKIKGMKKIDGRYLPTKVFLANKKTGGRTTMTISNINTKARFPDSVFSVESLGK